MRRVAYLIASLSITLIGCQGRTGLGENDIDPEDPTDAAVDGSDDTIVILDSSADSTTPDTSPVDTGTTDTGIDFFDVIPIPAEGGGVVGDCARCMRDTCGDAVNKCLNDPKCRSGLTCVLTTCLTAGGGGPGGFDFACLTKCFGGDLASAGSAISAFTCVIGKCGSSCGAILGGLGGGGGTTDAAPPKKDAGTPGETGAFMPGSGASFAGKGLPGVGLESPPEAWTPEAILAVDPSTRIDFLPEAFSPWAEEIHETACREKFRVCQ